MSNIETSIYEVVMDFMKPMFRVKLVRCLPIQEVPADIEQEKRQLKAKALPEPHPEKSTDAANHTLAALYPPLCGGNCTATALLTA
jgi:hypothetical protein